MFTLTVTAETLSELLEKLRNQTGSLPATPTRLGFDLPLAHTGYNKIQAIKVLREKLNLGLKDAEEIADRFGDSILNGRNFVLEGDFEHRLPQTGIGADDLANLIRAFDKAHHGNYGVSWNTVDRWVHSDAASALYKINKN